MPRRRALLAALALPAVARAASGWDALRSPGTAALIRHARAPGTGDPPGFALGDCATQRNLSTEGRAQALRLGAAFRANGIQPGRVVASRWCRALDTARLAFGAAEPLPALDSFFAGRGDRAAQTAAMRALLAAWAAQDSLLACVSHQVNITALTGIFPSEGEVIALRGTEVVARIRVS